MGTNFNELWNNPNFIDESEKAKIDFEVALIGKLIEARESKGLSQKQLAEMAGLKQPAIARLESMKATPKIDTLFKVLRPLGYTISIVSIEERVLDIADYIIENNATIRQTAEHFGISKSAVHKDISERLKTLNADMYNAVKQILEQKKLERSMNELEDYSPEENSAGSPLIIRKPTK